MVTTKYFKSNINQHYALKAVDLANEIVTLYADGDFEEAMKGMKAFFEQIVCHVLGHSSVNWGEIRNGFKSLIPEGSRVKLLEIELVRNRIYWYSKGEKLEPFAIDHSVRFVDWILHELGITNDEKGVFSDANYAYMKKPEHFVRDQEEPYKQKGNMYGVVFIRNAYRAEKYAKQGDKYTPLILERMAVEQCLKGLCDTHNIRVKKDINKHKKPPCPPKYIYDIPSGGAECKDLLLDKNIISKTMANEITAVLQRGNANTHEGYADYVFALIHGLEVLKYCEKFLK